MSQAGSVIELCPDCGAVKYTYLPCAECGPRALRQALAIAAPEAIRELHEPDGSQPYACAWCGMAWPCAPIRALDSAPEHDLMERVIDLHRASAQLPDGTIVCTECSEPDDWEDPDGPYLHPTVHLVAYPCRTVREVARG